MVETMQEPPPYAEESANSGAFIPDVDSSDPVCRVCGKALSYGGRGRKPVLCDDHKGSTGTRKSASAKEVELASDALRMLYEGIQPFLALLLPATAIAWSHQIDGLDERNRVMLKSNPKLVKQILSAGEQAGTVAFALSHVIAIAPVAYLGYQEFTGQIREQSPQPEASRRDW